MRSVCAGTSCCACALVRIRLPERILWGALGLKRVCLFSSGSFSLLETHQVRSHICPVWSLSVRACEGEPASFGRVAAAFEEEGPRGYHLSPHRCRDALVLVLVAGEERRCAEEGSGSDESWGTLGGTVWDIWLIEARELTTEHRIWGREWDVGRGQGGRLRKGLRTAVGLWPYRGFCGKVPREKWTGMLCMQAHLSHRRWENRHSQAVKTEPFFVFQLNSKGVGENRSGE